MRGPGAPRQPHDKLVRGIDTPDEPLVGVAGSREVLSPRQLVQAVQDQTEIGNRYVENLAEVVARAAFEDVTRKTFPH